MHKLNLKEKDVNGNKEWDLVLGEATEGSVWDKDVHKRVRQTTLEVFARDDSESVQVCNLISIPWVPVSRGYAGHIIPDCPARHLPEPRHPEHQVCAAQQTLRSRRHVIPKRGKCC